MKKVWLPLAMVAFSGATVELGRKGIEKLVSKQE
jgi:hypothetical protein